MDVGDAEPSAVDPASTWLSTRQRRTLILGTILIVLLAVGISVYQRVAPDMHLRADGYSKLGSLQGHDVWAKVSGDRIFVHVPDGKGGDLCASAGPFSPDSIPLCSDAFQDSGSSVFVAVVPPSSPATIITQDGTEVPATVIHQPGLQYTLAVRVAQNDSLSGARLK